MQDLPAVQATAEATIPTDLKGRVTFMAHDFFEPQPVKKAKAYFLRAILHDWGNPTCVKILRNLLPALEDGDRVLISDSILPPPNVLPNNLESRIRSVDPFLLSPSSLPSCL